MQQDDLIRVSDVFGVRRAFELDNYVTREDVDLNFIDALHAKKHVSVFGASKTGKSSLIEKQVGLNERLYVQCSDGFGINDFNDALLEAIYGRGDFEIFQEEEIATTSTTDGGIRINSKNIRASIQKKFFRKNRQIFRFSDKKEYDLANLGDFKTLFQDIGSSKGSDFSNDIFLIIDDFHKAERKTQRWLANLAKVLFDNTRVVFIFVGVWVEEKILSALCPELAGRIEDINCNIWSDGDLRSVVINGCTRLNIKFQDGFVDTIVKESNGSVYILQEACKEACRISGVREKGANFVEISKDLNVQKIVKETAAKHCNFADIHGELLSVDRINKSILFVYHAMISRSNGSSTLDMLSLQRRIEANFPDLEFDKNFAYNACIRFAKHPQAQKFQTVFRIHKRTGNNTVFISLVDKTFNIWLKGRRKDIMQHIEERVRTGKIPELIIS